MMIGPASGLADRRAIPSGAVESRWIAGDGAALRRIDLAGGRRGSILFFPGRGDAYEKYLETLAYWHGQGWHVTAGDWRGQAGSGRLGSDPVTGHIDDFGTWVGDLAGFWAQWKAQTPGPHILAAHSMGGHIALRALVEHRVDPDAAVLSAPLLGLRPGFVPLAVFHGAARLMCALGDRRRPAWKWNEKPGVPPDDRIDLLTHDPERYADELWWRESRPELVMGPPSWGWMERAIASMRLVARRDALAGVRCPVLLVATSADRLVEIGAIRRAAALIPAAELLEFGAEARHELLREEDAVRGRALAAIGAFLDRAAPPLEPTRA